MTVYVYNPGDGDTQVFSTFVRTWEYALSNGWTSFQEEDKGVWIIMDDFGSSGDIIRKEVDMVS